MKRYPMAHKIHIPPGTERVDMYHTDVAATFKRVRKQQAAAAAVVVLPALVLDSLPSVRPFTRYRKG